MIEQLKMQKLLNFYVIFGLHISIILMLYICYKMAKVGDKNSALVDEVKYRYNGVIMHYRKSVMQENAQRYLNAHW